MTSPQAMHGIDVFQVRFPEAESVFAMGSFNKWSTTATPMQSAGDGLWELKLPSDLNVGNICFYVLPKGEKSARIRSHRLDTIRGLANTG